MYKVGPSNYFNFKLNNFKHGLILSLTLILTLNIVSCFASPNRSIGISGDIGLSTTEKGTLCFEPLFNTTKIEEDLVEIEYLKMKKFSLLDFNVPDDQSQTILTIVPISDKYYILEKGQKICLDTDNPQLKQNTFRDLAPIPMVVLIEGVDGDEEIIVNFSLEFDYPYINSD